MQNTTVKLERDGLIARVILNRPETLNAVNRDLIAGIKEAFEELSADDSIRVVVLTGEGRGFSSGGDLNKVHEVADVGHSDPFRHLMEEVRENPRVLSILDLHEKVVIAAINGPAVGVGLEIAMAADFRIAKASARMGFVQSVMGMVPMYAFGLLPPLMRLPEIKKLMLLGEIIPAEEALRIGLIDEVVPDEDFDARVEAFAQRMAEVPSQVTMVVKRGTNQAMIADTLAAINSIEYAEFWLRQQPFHRDGANRLRERAGMPKE